jgi:hypothetical protein
VREIGNRLLVAAKRQTQLGADFFNLGSFGCAQQASFLSQNTVYGP